MRKFKITATTENEFKEQVYEISNNISTIRELVKFIKFLNKTPLDYGSIVYAQCAVMLATQRVMNSGKHDGITVFQAGFIGWEMVKKFMRVGDCGLSIIDWREMLYPQYKERFEKTISSDIFKRLQEKAKEIITKADSGEDMNECSLHPEVRKHMESIVNGEVPFGYTIKDEL